MNLLKMKNRNTFDMETPTLVTIATPTRDGYVCDGYLKGMVEIKTKKPENVNIERMAPAGCSDIVAARQLILETWLQQTETIKDKFLHVLLWIDADTVFSYKHFDTVLREVDSYPIVAVPQAKKLCQAFENEDVMKVAQAMNLTGDRFRAATSDYTISGLAEDGGNLYTKGTGFGFVAFTRDVFLQTLGEDTSVVNYQKKFSFTHTYDHATGKLLSEDLSFCRRMAQTYGSEWIVKLVCTEDGVGHDNCGDVYPSNLKVRRKLLEGLQKLNEKKGKK